MKHLFGKAISRSFSPTLNRAAVQLPAQTPAIYLFADHPTNAQAAAGTGALQTLSAWTQAGTTPFSCTYSFAAVNDPAPESTTIEEIYYEALNFRNEALGQIQTVVREVHLTRMFGPEALDGTTIQDLKNLFKGIVNYASDAELTEYLDIARDLLKLDFESRGFVWGRLGGIERLQKAIAFKAISLAAEPQIIREGDRHDRRYKRCEKWYQAQLNSVELSYDSDGDGKKETTTKAKATQFVSIR